MRDSLRGALVIGMSSLVEALRKRLLLVGMAFTIGLVLLSMAAASVSIGEQTRLIVDVGLAASSGLGSIIALALTISTFAGALKNRTAYTQLVRPVPRWAFVLGKYLGNFTAMVLVVTVMIVSTGVVVMVYGDPIPSALWSALWLSYVEMALVVSMAILFSTLTGPVMAATFTVGFGLAGNLAGDMLGIAESLIERGKPLGMILQSTYYVIPDLQDLSVRAQASNNLPVPPSYVLHGTLYGLSYAAAALILAMWVFSRREVL
jgi:ABC-type transport system involved in multi-copper enzyme maturation permease subunit